MDNAVVGTLESVGNDIIGFFKKLKNDVDKANALWNLLQSQAVRALLIKLGSDFLKAVKDGETAVAAYGANIAADTELIGDAQQIFADVEGGNSIIEGDLKTLGITL